MASSLSREIKGDKNRPFAVQPRSKIPVRRANPLNNDNEKRSSSKDEDDKKQRILRDSVEKLQNKRPSRIPVVVGRTHSKTDKNVISATRKRPLGRHSGINLQELRGKQGASIKTTANPQNAAKHSNPEHVTESTPPLRRRTQKHVTPLNTKQVSNDVKKPRDEDIKVQGESVQYRNGVCTSCKENHKKELEELKKENFEIVEELMQWVEDGDQENKTLEEIIEKNSDENVKFLVQISVMKKEMKALEKKNGALQTELDMKRAELGALGKEVSHFKTDELEYKKLRHETSRLIDQLEIQLDTLMNESARKISEKDKEMEELKEEKSSVIDELENQLASLTKENAQIILEKKEEMKELDKEKSRIVGQLKDQLEMSMNENARITSEKNKEITELKEEKSRAFGQFMDRLDSLIDENAQIVAEKDKKINELKNQKTRAIDQLEGEKWSVIGQFNNRIESIMNENARAISEKDKELNDLQNKMSNMFDQFNDRFSMIMDENDRNSSEKEAVISELKVEKSRSICQLKNQLTKLKKENSTLKTELLKESNKDKRLAELQEQIENLKEQKILTHFELDMCNKTDIKNEKLMSLKNQIIEMKRQTEKAPITVLDKQETQTFLLNQTDSYSHTGNKN